MEKEMHPTYRSKKPVKELSEIIGNREFFLPSSLANEINPETGKPTLMVCINGKKTFLPIEKWTPVSFENFCLLKDIGIFTQETDYSGEVEFNPFENELPKA